MCSPRRRNVMPPDKEEKKLLCPRERACKCAFSFFSCFSSLFPRVTRNPSLFYPTFLFLYFFLTCSIYRITARIFIKQLETNDNEKMVVNTLMIYVKFSLAVRLTINSRRARVLALFRSIFLVSRLEPGAHKSWRVPSSASPASYNRSYDTCVPTNLLFVINIIIPPIAILCLFSLSRRICNDGFFSTIYWSHTAYFFIFGFWQRRSALLMAFYLSRFSCGRNVSSYRCGVWREAIRLVCAFALPNRRVTVTKPLLSLLLYFSF